MLLEVGLVSFVVGIVVGLGSRKIWRAPQLTKQELLLISQDD